MTVDVFIQSESKIINIRRERDLNLTASWNEKGDHEVSFQLCDWGGKIPDPRTPIRLRDSTYGYFWSGYAAPTTLGGFFDDPSNVTGRGWQHTLQDDGWDEKKKWTAGTQLITMVFEAIAKCSHITGGIPFPGGLSTQLPEDTPEFTQQTPENVFDYVKDVFSYLATPLIWQIRNNPLTPMADQPSLEMKFVDLAPRYRVRLTKNDKFNPQFDPDIIYNQASAAYQNGLYESQQAWNPYENIPHLRKKRVNANAEIKTTTRAQGLVASMLNKLNVLRPINTVLELHCDTSVEAQYPATPAGVISDWPHHLIRPHFYIRILNDTSRWGKYKNIRDWYIVDVKHDFQNNKTTLTLGDPVLYDAFKLLDSYDTNRANIAFDSSAVSEPLKDADVVPVYGPTGDGASPPTTGEGTPIFDLDPTGAMASLTDHTKPTLRYGAGIDPRVLVDYGVSINFGREADSIGIKGFILVIPARVLAWELFHTAPPGSNTIPTDAMTIKLHNVYPFTAGNVATTIATCSIASGNPGATGTFATPQNFAQGGKIGVEVTVPSGVANSGFQLAVMGKKIFPDVGIND